MHRTVLLTILMVIAVPAFSESPLQIVLVQYDVDPTGYRSIDAFRDTLEPAIERAAHHLRADLVVFPEYINVFLLFRDYAPCITGSDTIEDALACIDVSEAEVPDLIEREARETAPVLRTLWSTLADRYDVAIVAGTAFVPAGPGDVRNRAFVFGADGELLYRQDKAFLTPFEQEVLRLDSGSVAAARPFIVDGREVALTICRDTFFDDWEQHLGDADVWLNIRANGQVYTQQVRSRFSGALPERVAATDVDIGGTASLNGAFLDLLWQGPSFVVDGRGRRIAETPAADGAFLLPFSVSD